MPDFNTYFTGDPRIDSFLNRGLVANPEHDNKTKKGKAQPEYITDYNIDPNAVNLSALRARSRESINRIAVGPGSNLSMEEYEEGLKHGIDRTISSYNSDAAYNRKLAETQSAWQQFGRFLGQAVVSETLLGTVKGFFEIGDGIYNLMTNNAYQNDPIQRQLQNWQDQLNKTWEIYEKDPNAAFDWDFGKVMNGAVSTFTTLSLMIPAAGTSAILGKLSKVTGLSKGIRATTRSIAARSISKARKALREEALNTAVREGREVGLIANREKQLEALRKTIGQAGRMERAVKEGSSITATAFFSRTGENMQEANQVYKDVLNQSINNMSSMSNEEFDRFVSLHPEFQNKSKDEIATDIAKEAAGLTFRNDYAMLLMDIAQFKALGPLFGNNMERAITARERIQSRNIRRMVANKAAGRGMNEGLEKLNFWNRLKETAGYAVSNPKNSIAFLELGEGFEEFYQGIQQDKGMEMATRYFDPTLTPKGVDSYLRDPSLWRDALWGSIGGILFGLGHRSVHALSNSAYGWFQYKTGHFTAEEYAQYKKGLVESSIEQMNGYVTNLDNLTKNVNQIRAGRNIYEAVKDEDGNIIVDKNGNVQFTDVTSEDEKNILIKKAIDEYVQQSTLNAVDHNTVDILRTFLTSSELEEYFQRNGIKADEASKTLAHSIADVMEQTASTYREELSNINDYVDAYNPYVTRAAARTVTNQRMRINEIRDELQINSIRAEALKQSVHDYENYRINRIFQIADRKLYEIGITRRAIEYQFKNKQISRTAYNMKLNDLRKQENAVRRYLRNNDNILSSEHTSELWKTLVSDDYKYISDLEYELDKESKLKLSEGEGFEGNESSYKKMSEQWKEFVRNNSNLFDVSVEGNIPGLEQRSLINERIQYELEETIAYGQLPRTEREYGELYEELAYSFDAAAISRLEKAVKQIRDYLINAKDFDEALGYLIDEDETKLSKELLESAKLSHFGYRKSEKNKKKATDYSEGLRNSAFEVAVREARKERKKREEARKRQLEESGTPNPVTEAEKKEEERIDTESSPEPAPTPEPIIISSPTGDEELGNGENEEEPGTGEGEQQKPEGYNKGTIVYQDEKGRKIEVLDDVQDDGKQHVKITGLDANGHLLTFDDYLTKQEIDTFANNFAVEQNAESQANPVSQTTPEETPLPPSDVAGTVETTDDSESIPLPKLNVAYDPDYAEKKVDYKIEQLFTELIIRTYIRHRDDAAERDKELNNLINDAIKQLGYFVKNGRKLYSENQIRTAYKKAMIGACSVLGNLSDSDNAFIRAANNAALGVDPNSEVEGEIVSASITNIFGEGNIIPKQIRNTIERFLNEYFDVVGGYTSDGKKIINLKSLFNYLIYSKDKVSKQYASQIYKYLQQYMASGLYTDKYIFTGYIENMSSKKFFDKLALERQNTNLVISQMHMAQNQRHLEKEASQAIEFYANNPGMATVTVRENGATLSVRIEYTTNGEKHNVEVGFLRQVMINKKTGEIYPAKHDTGFSNVFVLDKETNIRHLDSRWLFDALIEHSSPEAKELLDLLIDYNFNTRAAYQNRQLNDQQRGQALINAISHAQATKLLNNALIKELLAKGQFKLNEAEYENQSVQDREVSQARGIAKAISEILFYGQNFEVLNHLASREEFDFALDRETMTTNYNNWEKKVRTNYEQTAELQRQLEGVDSHAIGLNINVTEQLNTTPNGEVVNFADEAASYALYKNPTHPNAKHTPFVMFQKGKAIREIPEEGSTEVTNTDMGDYSIGFVVYDKGPIPYVATASTIPLTNDNPLLNDGIKQYLSDLIINHFTTGTYGETEIYDALMQLFDARRSLFDARRSLFRFIQVDKSGKNTTRTILVGHDKENHTITLYNGRYGKENTLITFHFNNGSNYVTFRNNGQNVISNSFAKDSEWTIRTQDEGDVTAVTPMAESLDAFNNFINTLFGDGKNSYVVLNRSGEAFGMYRRNHGSPRVVSTSKVAPIFTGYDENGKFVFHVKFGNYDRKFGSYGEFVLGSRGFGTRVQADANGSFVTHAITSVTIDATTQNSTRYRSNSNPVEKVFNDTKDAKTNGVAVEDVLKGAGVDQQSIDILTGKADGSIPIVSERVRLGDNRDANGYCDREGNVYITPKGIQRLSNQNPLQRETAINLLVHENIHSNLRRLEKENKSEYNKIIRDIREIFDYVSDLVADEIKNEPAGDAKILSDRVLSLITKRSKDGKATVGTLEEFMVECLTNPLMINYLNTHDWVNPEEADLSKLSEQKTIFQKILDTIFNLLSRLIKSTDIRNRSILAKTYITLANNSQIISQETTQANPADVIIGGKTDTRTEDTKKLDEIGEQLETVRKTISARVKKADDFDTSHKYIIDGKEVDESVTEEIHGGKTDIGAWGLPASLLGNTADKVARLIFENGEIPSGIEIANVINSEDENDPNSIRHLINQIQKIKDVLDNKFGKGKYRVITSEFILAGQVINEKGDRKTIAGMPDMIVYTTSGDVYIYDFKTKRVSDNGNATINEATLKGYRQQVNLYRQLMEANSPELKGKVHAEALIKFELQYPAPGENVNYSSAGEQLSINGLPIQSDSQYIAPYINGELEEGSTGDDNLITVGNQDYSKIVEGMPKEASESSISSTGNRIEDIIENVMNPIDDEMPDDGWDNMDDDDFLSVTDICAVPQGATSIDIFNFVINQHPNVSPNGNIVVSDMNDYVNMFPKEFRDNIQKLIDEGELIQTCS